jgi:hypothetical protein
MAGYGFASNPSYALTRTIHYDPLPPETRMIVIAAWQRGGLISMDAIEQVVLQQLPPSTKGN